MSRAYDEQLEEEARQIRAMKAKGYKQCNYCSEMFKPKNDELACDDCWEKIMDKD